MAALETTQRDSKCGVLITDSGGTASVLLNQPSRGNALGPQLVEELTASVAACAARSDIHTVVFRGQGANFCTGFDWSGTDGASDGELLQRFVQIELLLQAVWSAPMRSVVVVHGRCWGAGADLMAACDTRIATSGATFRFPGAAFGIVLGARRLTERVGSEAARQLVTSGAEIDAVQALGLGLVSSIADDLDEALALLAPPRVDRVTMAAVARASRSDLNDQDLAALVRSAARPGLAQRLRNYRATIVRK